MVHIDEKFKDANPQDTVENIIRLLRAQNMEAVENWIDSGIENCFSVRITIKGTTLGTNGKGVTKELARASGYAEMMERLQSGSLGYGTLKYADERQMSREEILDSSGSLLQRIADRVAAFENTEFSVSDLLDSCFGFGSRETAAAIPYFNADDGSTVYLPVDLIPRLYSTNGLAAGNSMEEAIVQGFSEIVERYCHCRILHEGLVPPTVPQSYLEQFPTAYGIIRSMEAAGYTVLIKDCSLAEGYPVVASVIIDKARHGYRVILGSSPVFEIALERSLTEMLQGTSVKTLVMTTSFHTGTSRQGRDITSALVSGSGKYPIDFFDGTPSYEFSPFPDRSNASNKDLVGYITAYLRQHKRTLLVRNLSHFGFSTYRMIVPGMSEVYTFSFVGKPSFLRLMHETDDVVTDLRKATPDKLLTYTVRYRSTPSAYTGPLFFSKISRIPMDIPHTTDRFLGMMSTAYAEWNLGNIPQCQSTISAAAAAVPAEDAEYLSCVTQYILQRRTGKSRETVLSQLRLFYSAETMDTFSDILARGENPFLPLFPHCDENCGACKWSAVCRLKANRSVKERLNLAAAEFDNARAFADLSALFDELSRNF